MNESSTPADELFAAFPHTPAEHFRLHFFGSVLACLDYGVSCAESFDAVVARFPFLASYNNEIASIFEGVSSDEAFAHWQRGLAAWEEKTTVHLPLKTLRGLLGLGSAAAMCFITVGLSEEDARFGEFFDQHQSTSGQRRCSLGLLRDLWRSHLDSSDFSQMVRQAKAYGLLLSLNPEAPNSEQAVQIPSQIWEVLRGDASAGVVPWALHRCAANLSSAADLLLAPEIEAAVGAFPSLFARGQTTAVIVRGSKHSGRRTLLGAVARQLGRNVLELRSAETIEEPRWREFASLAQLQNALPVVAFDLGPGEVRTVPPDWPRDIPLGIALGELGGITGQAVADAVTLNLTIPDAEARQLHWRRALPSLPADERVHVSSRYRLPVGQIHRAAHLAQVRAALAGRRDPTSVDIADALRSLNRQSLDALAKRCSVSGDWRQLCAGAPTLRELHHLESRCRHREKLPAMMERSASAGVRALFTGPSGTGKTHAARLLAACLQKDLYQLDLSAVVNKYVGETEKNLNRVLEAAEDHDVILLIDEGDSLLTQRTDVHSSNDRYGNMETNFLLQRLENYEGILIVTTNARARIDSAFERRMDVTVEFHAPDSEERWALWQIHLPARHDVRPDFLEEIAGRCELTGAQIRNATLHASLLALDHGNVIKTGHLESAIRREYAKFSGVCPLRHLAEVN